MQGDFYYNVVYRNVDVGDKYTSYIFVGFMEISMSTKPNILFILTVVQLRV